MHLICTLLFYGSLRIDSFWINNGGNTSKSSMGEIWKFWRCGQCLSESTVQCKQISAYSFFSSFLAYTIWAWLMKFSTGWLWNWKYNIPLLATYPYIFVHAWDFSSWTVHLVLFLHVIVESLVHALVEWYMQKPKDFRSDRVHAVACEYVILHRSNWNRLRSCHVFTLWPCGKMLYVVYILFCCPFTFICQIQLTGTMVQIVRVGAHFPSN